MMSVVNSAPVTSNTNNNNLDRKFVAANTEKWANPTLILSNEDKQQQAKNLLSKFVLSMDQMKKIKQTFKEDMTRGMAPREQQTPIKSSLLMENTYITQLLNGKEQGDYLSLDLGSTNFRVCHLRFDAQGRSDHDRFHVTYYDIPSDYRTGTAAPLFDHIAVCIKDFVHTSDDLKAFNKDRKLPLGFTFSFPMTQRSIKSALLNTWTKSYDIPEVVNNDPVEILQKSIDKIDLHVQVVAILNDSTGTLLKGAYLNSCCKLGVILGTGFNICYEENDVTRIRKWNDERLKYYSDVRKVLIDIECGAFGDNGVIDFVKSDVDLDLDKESLFPHSFSFEKLLAGKFLGSIVRRAIKQLTAAGLMFEGVQTDELNDDASFPSSLVSNIEGEQDNEFTAKAITMLGYNKYSQDDINLVKYLCSILSVRAASLVASLFSAILDWINESFTVIAIDGSLYKYHPKLDALLRHFTSQLSPLKAFDLILAEDGSGKGAGLLAAIATTLPNPKL